MLKDDIGFYVKIINALNKTKWWILILLFISFLTNSFKNEIIHLINYKVLNKDVIIDRLDDDILIENALYELMEKTKSDRAYIFRFHNGVNYYDGSHKSKMSCDFEVTRKGISKEAQRLQDIPVGLFARWIKDVIKYQMIHPYVSEIEDIRTRLELERQGINGIAVVPYYRDGRILALIGIDYVREITEEEFNLYISNKQYSLEFLKNKSNEIGNLLK